MRYRAFFVPWVVGVLLLAGCAAHKSGSQASQPQESRPYVVNPYSAGGFSDPGPNYPATGH